VDIAASALGFIGMLYILVLAFVLGPRHKGDRAQLDRIGTRSLWVLVPITALAITLRALAGW